MHCLRSPLIAWAFSYHGGPDSVCENTGVVSYDTASGASDSTSSDHSHQLTGDASCAWSGTTLTADCSEHAGEFEDDVVVECAGCADRGPRL